MATDNNWNLIYAYTRSQAIEDGVLVDVTEQAKAIGFRLHTVVTDHLFHGYFEPPAGLEGEGQSVTGRLHDLMVLALFAARKAVNTDRVTFKVDFLMVPGGDSQLKEQAPRLIRQGRSIAYQPIPDTV